MNDAWLDIKAFNMITNKNKAKKMTKDISCDCKCKFNCSCNTTIIQIKNGIMKHVNASVKIIVSAKKITVGILAHVFVRIGSI